MDLRGVPIGMLLVRLTRHGQTQILDLGPIAVNELAATGLDLGPIGTAVPGNIVGGAGQLSPHHRTD